MDVRGKYSFLALLLKGVHGQKKCLFLVPNFRGQDATENNIRLHAAVRRVTSPFPFSTYKNTLPPVAVATVQARSMGIHQIWRVEAGLCSYFIVVLRYEGKIKFRENCCER
jgi:hypothetical protein